MKTTEQTAKLNGQQQRGLKLLFKFRFGTSRLLAEVIGIRSDTMYQILESLVDLELVVKEYKPSYRIERRPAYYYLSKAGVTTVRQLLDVKESVVHALYKNDTASDAFIRQCLDVLMCYAPVKKSLPSNTELLTKAEISKFSEFPKTRPDLYIRTPGGREAIVVFGNDTQPFIHKKRLQEIIEHSEDEGWDGDYPLIAFVLRDASTANSFLYRAARTLDSMGIDETELFLLAAPIEQVATDTKRAWASVYRPHEKRSLFL